MDFVFVLFLWFMAEDVAVVEVLGVCEVMRLLLGAEEFVDPLLLMFVLVLLLLLLLCCETLLFLLAEPLVVVVVVEMGGDLMCFGCCF